MNTDQDANVLKCAVVALGNYTYQRIIPILSRLLLESTTPLLLVRVAALDTPAHIGAHAVLHRALDNPNVSFHDRAHQMLYHQMET